jgi:hypothetical protein
MEVNLEGGNTFSDELSRVVMSTLGSKVPGEIYCNVDTAKLLFWRIGFSVKGDKWALNFNNLTVNIVDESEMENGLVKYVLSPLDGERVECVFTHVTGDNAI